MNFFIGFILSFVGFLITLYIQKKKQQGKILACPRVIKNCGTVTSSAYSTLFGIPLEKFGSAYYKAFTAVFFLLILGIQVPLFSIIIVASFGVIFSLYLVCIQAFIIRSWCVWCTAQALCAVGVFLVLVL